MEIIMVHGIWDKGTVFRRMAKVLTEQGHNCHAPDLEPANGAHGLADLAQKLERTIDQTLGSHTRFALIGFSMGSLVSRYYMQVLGGASRVSHLFCISGPQHGTLTAHLTLGKASRDMRIRSKLLLQLNANTSSFENTIVHCYRTPFDLLIIPSRSSELEFADGNHIVPAIFHHRMLTHPTVHQHIAQALKTDC